MLDDTKNDATATGTRAGSTPGASTAPKLDFAPYQGMASSKPSGLSPVPGLPVLPPRTALVELALFFLGVLALVWLMPSFPDLNELQPHPFWLPVLLLSLQYGTVSGLLAAGVAILFTAYTGWPEQDIGENHFTYLIRIWAQPVLWIGAALVVGQFRLRQIAERRELHRMVDELHGQRAAIAEYSANLRTRCETLERQIAGRRDPAATALLDAIASLRSGNRANFNEGFARCIDIAFGAAQSSVFVVDGDGLKLAASHGWEADAPWLSTIAASSPLFDAITGEVRGLIVLRADDEPGLAGQGVCAVPLLSADGQRVMGMLKIEMVAPDQLSEATLPRLEALASAIVVALDQHESAGRQVDSAAGTGGKTLQKKNRRQIPWSRQRAEVASAKDAEPAAEKETLRAVLKKPKVIR